MAFVGYHRIFFVIILLLEGLEDHFIAEELLFVVLQVEASQGVCGRSLLGIDPVSHHICTNTVYKLSFRNVLNRFTSGEL